MEHRPYILIRTTENHDDIEHAILCNTSGTISIKTDKIKNTLSGKVDKVDGKGLSTNDYTSEEKTKLSGFASGSQVNVLEGIQRNGNTVTSTNKIANISVPTATSDLTND